MAYEGTVEVDYSRYKALRLENVNGVMTVTLSNPGRRNAVTPQMSLELAYIWDDLLLDPSVKVIVLTGDGADFCSGADVKVLNESFADAPAPNPINMTVRSARRHMYAMLECEKPVIAKVRGVAYGLGANLALACDMVFVDETAVLCDSHVRAGMVAGDGGVLLWPLLCGMHRAKEYLMTGEPVPAETAERIGLVNRCVPAADLDNVVATIVDKLLALPPHAVNYTKLSLNTALKNMTGPAFEASIAYEIYSMTTGDFSEATTAFREKRKPVFNGT